MINLFEYKNKAEFSENHFDELEMFLDDIWAKREKSGYYLDEERHKIETQRFIQFFRKDKTLKSNKYVGVIHFEGETINLLPKIFYTEKEQTEQDINIINKHILWWLSYCRKLKFPNYLTGLNTEKSDFLEVLIYLFSKYTRELLNSVIYQKYTEVNKELSFVKGRINFNDYINNNLSRGKNHKISCEFDAFEMDNDFNRCIKFVSKLLLSVTKENQSQRYLRDILFILDEVKDEAVSVDKMKRMKFNPMFSDFETVRDYCVLFLDNSVSFNYKNNLRLFAFLLPMEYVFEDFIFGFIDKEISEISARAQVGSNYLDVAENFGLKPDLMLNVNNKRVIADTKYKIVYSDDKDPKKGISQNDLYQMLAYAIRYKVNEIVLYYPNTVSNYQEKVSEIQIIDELANKEKIEIRSYQLPIINYIFFDSNTTSQLSLSKLFDATKIELCNSIKRSLKLE